MATILLVEDDLRLSEILEKRLTQVGHVVKTVTDGEEALKELRAGSPDLLLLDIILPKLSGFDILETMQRDVTLSRPKTIIISNSGQPVEIERARALGAIDFLVKADLDPDEVMQKVQDNLNVQSATDASAGAQAAQKVEGAIRVPGSVLVVEDDKFLRDLIVQKLKREGFPVIEAITGTEALRVVKESQPAVVLLDLILPGLDGFEILKRLKEDQATSSIPIIILSNLGQREDVERGLRLGAVDFMIKAHFTPGEIVAKVKMTLGGTALGG